jgi:hypothetical protein
VKKTTDPEYHLADRCGLLERLHEREHVFFCIIGSERSVTFSPEIVPLLVRESIQVKPL